VLNTGLRAEDAVLPDNPYAAIVGRNPFGLNPPPPDAAAQDTNPPPKITVTGVMSISGQSQVLFKTPGTPKPGQPPQDKFYTLSEGERQDDVEVVRINDEANPVTVTFNNHGKVQEIQLTNTTAIPTLTSGGGGLLPAPSFPLPTVPPGGNAGGNNPVIGFGNRLGGGTIGAQNRGGPGGNNFSSGRNNFSSSLNNAPTPGTIPAGGNTYNIYQPAQALPQMSPEEQYILMEAQRLKYQQEGNPLAALIPPTPLNRQMNNGGNNQGN
jgi:hypothetical protein